MASGSFQSGTSHNCYAYINWSSTAGTGGSSVYANLYFKAKYRYNFTFRKGYSLAINGNSVSGNGVRVTSAGDWQLLSHSVWVGYTGNKTINISGNANCTTVTSSSGGNLPNYTVSGNAVLDKVGTVPSTPAVSSPKDMTISETAKTITVSWNKSTSYSNWGIYRIDVSVDGGSWTYVSGDLNFNTTSWTYNIPNTNLQGSTYRFRVSCGNDVGWSTHSYSGTVTVNKLASGDISVANTFNPYTATQNGTNSVLPITFTKGSQTMGGTLYYKAQIYYGDTLVSPTIFTSSANGTSLNITIPSVDYVNMLGSTKYSGTFTIKAWLENQNGTMSNKIQKKFMVDINTDGGAEPSVNGLILSGGALNNPSTCFVVHESNITITCGAVTLNRTPTTGSSVTATYSIKNGDEEISTRNTGSFECWQSGTFTCSVTVRDSRGLSTIVEKRYVVQSYTAPRVEISTSGRSDSTPTNIVINYSIYYSPIYQYTDVNTKGNQLNGIAVQQYSKSGGTWTNYSTGKIISGVDTNFSYTFEIRVADKFNTNSYVYDSCNIPTIKSMMSLRSYGVGFGCVPQVGNSLEVGGRAQLNGTLTVDGTSSMNDTLSIRCGDSSNSKKLIDFGWDESVAKYGLVMEQTGELSFDAYDGKSSKNIIKVNSSDNIVNIQANTINNGLLRTSGIDEVVGLYDASSSNSRYFWMGRNKDSNGVFYFNGESSVNKFLFNKPIEAPTINGYTFDFDTQNQVDTWVLVKKEEKIQHLWIGWSDWISCGTNGCGVKLKYRYNEALRLCELNWDGVVNSTIGGNTMGFMWNGFPDDKKPRGNIFIPIPNPASDAGLVIRYYPITNDITAGRFTLTSLKNNVNNVYICGTFVYCYAK